MIRSLPCYLLLVVLLAGSAAGKNNNDWRIDSTEQWTQSARQSEGLAFDDGLATPTADTGLYRSVVRTFPQKRSARSIVFEQSPVWENWNPIGKIAPVNLYDAPVLLTVGPDDYWVFGRYNTKGKEGFVAEDAELDGFDVPLKTTPFPKQFDAPGGLKKGLGGYHAWQSRDMVHWVHHGPVTERFSAWVTTAEYADGKAYIYYDYPNDQDPHLYIDDDLTDGIPGKNMGLAFADPSHGSDCAFIRDLQGNFHVIYEDWSPIHAGRHSWDSPLAGHAVSADGIGNFKIMPPAVDHRTKPTGEIKTYKHPHWVKEDPEHFKTNIAEYEVHEPEQNAYGDWASISIGGQYYLFGDFHPAGKPIRIGWFTSSSLDKPFTFCGEIGRGHPDPDIGFAEGQFYLVNQTKNDYVSPGPWVEKVEARVGVDTDNDDTIDQWTDWQEVKERYDYVKGFSKQVERTPASMDLSALPDGFGFCFEFRVKDATENKSKPMMDRVTLSFAAATPGRVVNPVPLNAPRADRAAWMDDAKFGLFIHWGLYSQMGQGEWVMYQKKIPLAEYAKLATTFNPVKFDADKWVQIAKNAGMKYITITSKHHDGFAMFDSAASDYNIVDATPFRRDVIKELSEACKREGIKLGLYYSQTQDWHHAGAAISRNRPWDPAQAGDFQEYLDTVSIPQIKELLKQYQPDTIWFDTPHQMTSREGRRFAETVRSTKPDTLMNSRLMYHGYQVARGLTQKQLDELKEIGVDFLSYRDRTIPKNSPWEYWETCMTLNNAWGFNATDHSWKTPAKVIQQLVEVVSKGGTFLLNVGPTGQGEIPAESQAVLSEVGDWLEVNGEAIYGATPTSLKGAGAFSAESLKRIKEQEKAAVQTGARKLKKIEPEFVYEWLATGKDGKVYIHLFQWPTKPFVTEGFQGKVAKAYLLANPEKILRTSQTGNTLTVDLPVAPADERATVLCLDLKQEK